MDTQRPTEKEYCHYSRDRHSCEGLDARCFFTASNGGTGPFLGFTTLETAQHATESRKPAITPIVQDEGERDRAWPSSKQHRSSISVRSWSERGRLSTSRPASG